MLEVLDTFLQLLTASVAILIAYKGGRWSERIEGAVRGLAESEAEHAGELKDHDRRIGALEGAPGPTTGG